MLENSYWKLTLRVVFSTLEVVTWNGEWLMENGFQGLEGQLIPTMTDEFVQSVTDRYTELYEAMTGQQFNGRDYNDVLNTIENNINQAVDNL